MVYANNSSSVKQLKQHSLVLASTYIWADQQQEILGIQNQHLGWTDKKKNFYLIALVHFYMLVTGMAWKLQ